MLHSEAYFCNIIDFKYHWLIVIPKLEVSCKFQVILHCGNLYQNILKKVKKSRKVWQDQKIYVSFSIGFDPYCQKLISEGDNEY